MRKIFTRLLNLLFPLKCPLCGSLTEGDFPRLCPSCLTQAEEELSLPCPICHNPASACRCGTDNLHGISNAIGEKTHISVGFYRPRSEGSALSRLIYALKHDTDDSTARVCADLLSHALLRQFLEADADIRQWTFTYPPRTKASVRRDGLDQAQRLAKLCAKRTGASYAPLFCRRGGNEQKSLTGSERMNNAALSLQLKSPSLCQGKKIILVDDIITTGATMTVCAELLRNAGAEAVFCASVLKTMPGSAQKEKAKPTAKPLWFKDV